MRKINVLTFVSLDGVMQGPGAPEEDTSDGFRHGGWTVGYFDEFLGSEMGKQMGHPFDLLLGRRTYDIFASHWPRVTEPGADLGINKADKFVATNRPLATDWNGTARRLEGDVVEAIRKVKAGSGPELQVHGSGGLIQMLLQNDLVDELWLKLFPVTLGGGRRLFAGGTIHAGFELVESGASPSGVILAKYRRAGAVKSGSFALAG
ncbi:MAG TPA: dihydrofolate reductase family protein [Polyangiaceae bacterium]|nr:dihydrofolate reductase family protein [Polyangiaceae bacterium]